MLFTYSFLITLSRFSLTYKEIYNLTILEGRIHTAGTANSFQTQGLVRDTLNAASSCLVLAPDAPDGLLPE